MKILLIKTSAIGDVIQTFPVLEYLRNRFPQATIDWVVEQSIAPLLQAHPLIDAVLTIHSKKWRKKIFSYKTWKEIFYSLNALRRMKYDLVFDLQGNLKSGLVALCVRSKVKVGFDAKGVREKANLLFTSHKIQLPSSLEIRTKYVRLVQSHFHDEHPFSSSGILLKLTPSEEAQKQELLSILKEKKRPYWMICFGSKWKSKQLPEVVLKKLLEKSRDRYAPFFLFVYGNGEEKIVAEHLSSSFSPESLLCPSLSLPLWQNMMAECDLILTVDSAALHLAATAQVPSFSVFGPSLASIYKPPGSLHMAVQRACPYKQPFSVRCPKLRSCSEHPCMQETDAEELFRALIEHQKEWQKQATGLEESASHISKRLKTSG